MTITVIVVRVSDLKSGDPELGSRSDQSLDLFQVIPGSTPRPHLYKANWFASSFGILI